MNAGTPVEKPADPTRAGYDFTGWYSAASGGTLYSWPHTVDTNITMHAQWREKTQPPPTQYTVTFDSHGGTVVPAVAADSGTSVEKPTDPTRVGYNFTGWYSAATGGTKYTWPHTVNATITVHAQWTPVSYNIIYNLDGGTNPGTSPASYTIESSAIALPIPTRTGYTFDGWFTNSGLTGTMVTTIAAGSTGNKTFYAKWTQGRAGITISYWVNQQDQISSSAASATVSKNGPSLTIAADGAGYSDQHWYINGVEDASKAGQSSYSFSGADKDIKTYTIGLRVKKDNQYYSTQFAVTVTN